MGTHIRGDESRSPSVRSTWVWIREVVLYLLSRVTGGANGRCAQIRSLINDEQYTPRARTKRSLQAASLLFISRKRRRDSPTPNLVVPKAKEQYCYPCPSSHLSSTEFGFDADAWRLTFVEAKCCEDVLPVYVIFAAGALAGGVYIPRREIWILVRQDVHGSCVFQITL